MFEPERDRAVVARLDLWVAERVDVRRADQELETTLVHGLAAQVHRVGVVLLHCNVGGEEPGGSFRIDVVVVLERAERSREAHAELARHEPDVPPALLQASSIGRVGVLEIVRVLHASVLARRVVEQREVRLLVARARSQRRELLSRHGPIFPLPRLLAEDLLLDRVGQELGRVTDGGLEPDAVALDVVADRVDVLLGHVTDTHDVEVVLIGRVELHQVLVRDHARHLARDLVRVRAVGVGGVDAEVTLALGPHDPRSLLTRELHHHVPGVSRLVGEPAPRHGDVGVAVVLLPVGRLLLVRDAVLKADTLARRPDLDHTVLDPDLQRVHVVLAERTRERQAHGTATHGRARPEPERHVARELAVVGQAALAAVLGRRVGVRTAVEEVLDAVEVAVVRVPRPGAREGSARDAEQRQQPHERQEMSQIHGAIPSVDVYGSRGRHLNLA